MKGNDLWLVVHKTKNLLYKLFASIKWVKKKLTEYEIIFVSYTSDKD